MTASKQISQECLKRHWFWLAAVAVVAANALIIAVDDWQAPQIREFGVLFDFAVLIPALYLICYRSLRKKAVVRAIAFACLGVWVAGHVIPETHQSLISQIGWIRYVGLAVLIIMEIRLGIEIWRLAFRNRAGDAGRAIQQKAESEGVPPWVAKLMAAEAKFWDMTWQIFRRLLGR